MAKTGSPKIAAAGAPLDAFSETLPGLNHEELTGSLIVIEGPDGVGRSTQVRLLRQWLEQRGHAVMDTGMARSPLAGEGIRQAKQGNTLGPLAMTLYYATDFADRLEHQIIPALRSGFVVITDRYTFSIMARAIARGESAAWIEQTVGFGLTPHVVFYLKAEVKDLAARVITGRGTFDYWESGMDAGLGEDLYESFVKYQTRVIMALDNMAERYQFEEIDATKPAEEVFRQVQKRILKSDLAKRWR